MRELDRPARTLYQQYMHSTNTHSRCNGGHTGNIGPWPCSTSHRVTPGKRGARGARAPIQRLRPLSSQPPREGWAVLCRALASDPLLGSVRPQAPGPAPHPARSSAPSRLCCRLFCRSQYSHDAPALKRVSACCSRFQKNNVTDEGMIQERSERGCLLPHVSATAM